MSKARYGNVLALLMLAVFIFVGSVYAVGIFSQQDAAVNVTGTAYADSYTANQELQESFVTVLPMVGFLVAVVAVILIIGVAKKH